MSQSYRNHSNRRRPHQSHTYRSREYRLRQYRKRRIRKRLLFSLFLLTVLVISGHVISIYASKRQTGEPSKKAGNPSENVADSSESPDSSPDTVRQPDTGTSPDDGQPDNSSDPADLTVPNDKPPKTDDSSNTDEPPQTNDPSGTDEPLNADGSSGTDEPLNADDPSNTDEPPNTDDSSNADETPNTDGSQTDPDSKGTDTPDETEFNFENTLFIGDSRTEGLFINTGLTEATFYAVRGLNVENIYTNAFIKDKTILAQKEKEEKADKKETKKKKKKDQDTEEEKGVTILEALKYHSWRKIYIMLGVNELGWAYESIFIDCYSQLIEDIRTLQPDAEIIIQSILPVTKEKSDNDDIYNNKRIKRYNELIQAMAGEKEVTYADLTPAVSGKNGALPEKGSSDGVHLTKSYYLKWLNYLIEHEI